MWEYVRSRQWRRVVAPGIVALAVAIVVNWPVHDERRLNALAVMNVGVALAEQGDLAGATVKFRGAVGEYPESAEANGNLAQALALKGEFAAAIPYYTAALRAEPNLAGMDFNLGVALERVGRREEALSHYERAVELDPDDAEARAAVGRLRQSEP
jgi:superkiller protein 3